MSVRMLSEIRMELAPRLRAADKVAERWPACQSVRPSATGRARPRCTNRRIYYWQSFEWFKFKNLGRPTRPRVLRLLPGVCNSSRESAFINRVRESDLRELRVRRWVRVGMAQPARRRYQRSRPRHRYASCREPLVCPHTYYTLPAPLNKRRPPLVVGQR